MIQIRSSIFETNSSSSHCIVITTDQEWKKFKNGELVLDMYKGELKPITQNTKVPKKLENGTWEFEGNIYNSLFDIDSKNYIWYNRDKMLYEAFLEDPHDIITKRFDHSRIAISIFGYDS